MARNFDGSADFAVASSVGQLGIGTIAGWINPVALPGATARSIVCTFYEDAQSEQFTTHDKTLFFNSSGIIKSRVYDGSGGIIAASTSALAVGTWSHVGQTFSNADDLGIWFNGVREATSTMGGDSYAAYTTPSFSFCRVVDSLFPEGETTRIRANAKLAEWGIWTVILTADEMRSLAAGFSPSFVRPQSLRNHWRIIGRSDPELPSKGSVNLTLTSAPPVADHPRVIMPGLAFLMLPGVSVEVVLMPQIVL